MKLENHLKKEDFRGNFKFIDFDPYSSFGSFRSLHGDWTCYGRLLIADYLQVSKVLYLDSDIVVEEDVLKLENFDFEGLPVAAVGGGKFRYTLGHNFYMNRVGIDPDLDYFNAGVILLNLEQWRLQGVKQKCLEIARRFPKELPSHDQSILNILCSGNFGKLPSAFNCEWAAADLKPTVASNMIFHFIGSPKPWDPFGFLIHNGYSTWIKYVHKDMYSHLGSFKVKNLKRAWEIRRSYIRSLQNRLLSLKDG